MTHESGLKEKARNIKVTSFLRFYIALTLKEIK
jgi:hypothetical protein